MGKNGDWVVIGIDYFEHFVADLIMLAERGSAGGNFAGTEFENGDAGWK